MGEQHDLPGFAPSADSSADRYGVRRLVMHLRREGASNSRIRELCAVLLLCRWATESGRAGSAGQFDASFADHRRLFGVVAAHLGSADFSGLTADSLQKSLTNLAFKFSESARAPHAPYADCLRAFADVLHRTRELPNAALEHAVGWLAELPDGSHAERYLVKSLDDVDEATGDQWAFIAPKWLRSFLRDLTGAPSTEPTLDASLSSGHFMTLVAQHMGVDTLGCLAEALNLSSQTGCASAVDSSQPADAALPTNR